MNELRIDRNLARWIALGLGFVGALVMGGALVLSSGKFDNQWSYIGLAVTILGAAGFILLDPRALMKTATGRSGQYALTSVVMSICFVAFVAVMYWIVWKVNPAPTDLTALKKYQLSQKTIDLLAGLKEDVHATGFFNNQELSSQNEADLWLRQYKQYSNGKFTYEFIDPDRNPLAAKDARSGTIVFSKGEQKATASVVDEQNLTNSLVRVLTGKARKAYLITGHGELSTEDVGGQGLGQISQVLGNANVTLTSLNLLEKKSVPDDADLIIVAGPKSQFAPSEVDAISAYLDKGKAAMFMFDPGSGGGALSFGVVSADINVDGSKIVTGGSDGTARLWDGSGKEVATLRGHTAVVNDVVFSPDGKQVATASFDNTIRIWNASTGEQVTQLKGTINNIQRIAYSPDGKYLASVGADQTANVWDVSNNYTPMSYSPIKLTVPLLTVAFSPDGATLALSGGGTASGAQGSQTTIFLRETATGKELLTKALPTNSIVAMAFSADGKTLTNATFDGTLGTFDVSTGETKSQTLYSAETAVSGFGILADGKLVFALGDGTIHIHAPDATSTDGDTVLKEHTGRIWTLRVSADGKSFVTASKDGTARVWEVGQTASALQLTGHEAADKLMSYLKDKWGITVDDDVVIDLPSAEQVGSPVIPVTFLPTQYDQSSPITQPLAQAHPMKQVVFQTARSISTDQAPPTNVTLSKLVNTNGSQGASWGETNPPSNGQIQPSDYDPATDKPGPVALAVSGENATTKARIVVFGDSDFATDTLLQNTTSGNADLIVNAINWLSAKEDIINLPTTNVGVRTIDKPLQGPESVLLLVVSWCCLPGGIGLGGAVVWFVRRQRR